tara:strand:- start:256 stop:1008 length:753 start_codon:yes stop_codon:yes gene_type:complete
MAYRKGYRGRGGRGGGGGGSRSYSGSGKGEYKASDRIVEMQEISLADDILDAKFGFARFGGEDSGTRLGWMLNMQPSMVPDTETGKSRSCVDYYFLQEDGGTFKATLPMEPYFYIATKPGRDREVEDHLRRKFPAISSYSSYEKEDLDLRNHLSGLRKVYKRISFRTVQDLISVKSKIRGIVTRNQKKEKEAVSTEFDLAGRDKSSTGNENPEDFIEDIREYDVPYYIRCAMDLEVRVGLWYEVTAKRGE